MLRRQFRVSATARAKSEERVTDRAGNPDEIARLSTAAPNLHSRSHLADRGQGQRSGPWRRDGVTAQEIYPEPSLVLLETPSELHDPVCADCRRKRRRQQIVQWPRSHRREIGQI